MKKLSILLLSVALLLTGCRFRAVSGAVSEVLATAPELERVETVTFSLYSVNTEYADGSSERRVYDWDHVNAYTSCSFYENGTKIGTEVYTTDEHGNILTATPDWEGGENRSYTYTYDESGNIRTMEAFLEGQPDSATEYTYNTEGVLTKTVVTSVNGLRSEYRYDDLGRETERLDYVEETLSARTVTAYADHGKRAKVTVYDESGNVTYWEDYSYDLKSSMETVLEYAADGELLQKRLQFYDTYDQLMRLEAYAPDGELLYTTYQHVMPHKFIEYVEVTEPAE